MHSTKHKQMPINSISSSIVCSASIAAFSIEYFGHNLQKKSADTLFTGKKTLSHIPQNPQKYRI